MLDHRQCFRVFVLSIGEAGHEATTAPASSSTGWRSPASGARATARRRTGSRSGVPWPGQGVGWLASRGCCRRGPCWRCSISGSASGTSFSRSVTPAMRRRRRPVEQPLAGDRRQAGQGNGETAHRRPIGRAVAWSWCRGTGKPRLLSAWTVLAVLDRRQCFRVFVLSIGEAGHETTTAPGRAAPGRRSPASGPGRRPDSAPAADRACRGLVRVSRVAGKSRLLSAWPASSSAWKAIAGKWARATARRHTGSRSGVPWPGQGVGVLASRGCAAGVARAGGARSPANWRCCGQRRAAHRAAPGRRSPASGPWRPPDGAPAADRACRGLVRVSGVWQASVAGVCSCWRCSITGSASGSSFSRSVKPAMRRRRRQVEQPLEGDRRQAGQGDGETAHRQPIGRAVAWSGSRGARSPAVLPGLRSLDR